MHILGLLILATEEKGFGLDFNPLETNLINLAILVGLLVYFGSKTLSNILSERRNKIAEAVREAEERQKAAAVALAKEQEKLKLAQSEAERIIQEAQSRAETAKLEIASQAEKDIEHLQETAVKDLSNQQEQVLTALRQRITLLAIAQAEGYLKGNLDENAQQTLIERSIAQLGG